MGLTISEVKDKAPSERDVFLWDTDVRGFGAKITPEGGRSWVFQYRTAAARSRRMKLGRWPDMTLQHARELAARYALEVRAGGDPMADKQAARTKAREHSARTLAVLGAEYLADIEGHAKPKSLREQRRIFQKYIVPELGDRPVTDLTEAEVKALYRSVKSRAPVMARRVVTTLRAIVYWCRDNDYGEPTPNPFRHFARRGSRPGWGGKDKSRERFLTADEVARLGAALTTAETTGLPVPPSLRKLSHGLSAKQKAKLGTRPKRGPYKVTKEREPVPANPYAIACIRFLLLSGWRKEEALTLQWDYLNTDSGRITLPVTKSDMSRRIVGKSALDVLTALPRFGPYVFAGGREGQPLRELRRTWGAVRHAAGLNDVRLHDLRHSFASFTAQHGYSLEVIGSLLGHQKQGITSRYTHLTDTITKQAADTVSAYIARALQGDLKGAKVLEFRRAEAS